MSPGPTHHAACRAKCVCCIPQSVTVPGEGDHGDPSANFPTAPRWGIRNVPGKPGDELDESDASPWWILLPVMTTLSREIARPAKSINGRRRWSRSVRESVPRMNSVKPGRLGHQVDVAISGLWSSSFEPFLFHLGAGRQPKTLIGSCDMHPFLAASGLRHSRPSSAAQARVQLLRGAAKIAAVTITVARSRFSHLDTVVNHSSVQCNPGNSRSSKVQVFLSQSDDMSLPDCYHPSLVYTVQITVYESVLHSGCRER